MLNTHDQDRVGLFKNSKLSLILFVFNSMIGWLTEKRQKYPRKWFERKKKKPGLKFNPWRALIGLSNNYGPVQSLLHSWF